MRGLPPYAIFEQRAAEHNARAVKRGIEGRLSADDLIALWIAQDRYCPLTLRRFGRFGKASIDHVVPLTAGGTNTFDNVIYIRARENAAKADYTLRDFCLLRGYDFQTVQRRIDWIHTAARVLLPLAG